MKNSNYSKAKILTILPIFIMVFVVISLVLAAVLEEPNSRGALYTIFALVGLIGLVVTPLPCLVMTILGVVNASKAKKEGVKGAGVFLILGIIEIIFSILVGIFAAMISIGSQYA
jgi:hypothetical protein